jgi:hypothetical protein
VEVSEVVLESIRHARTWDEKQAEKVERGKGLGKAEDAEEDTTSKSVVKSHDQ